MSEPVSDDGLKLTTYFGERDRAGGRLLADALLDLYGERRLRASVLVRGAEGFGRRHHLRTDTLLSLSEDLPVVSVAVDTRERIEATLPSVLALQRRGVITVERARLVSGESGAAMRSPRESGAETRSPPGEQTKLTVYVGRRERSGTRPAHVEQCELLHRRGIAGVTVLLGVDGTRQGRRTRARFFGANGEVPTMVIAVGAADRIAAALPELASRLREPLITLERVRVCKRDGQLLTAPTGVPVPDEPGRQLWQKLMIYTSQAATVHGRPLSREIVRRLRADGAAGATSLRGIWGFHGEHAPHGDRLLQLRRRVPVVTIVVDTPERIARSFAIVDELTAEQGLVTSEFVPAMAAGGESERVGDLRLAGS